jgi:hypothetical protein
MVAEQARLLPSGDQVGQLHGTGVGAGATAPVSRSRIQIASGSGPRRVKANVMPSGENVGWSPSEGENEANRGYRPPQPSVNEHGGSHRAREGRESVLQVHGLGAGSSPISRRPWIHPLPPFLPDFAILPPVHP